MPGALQRMRMALKPGGQLFLLAGPIWAGHRGHHLYPRGFPDDPGRVTKLLSFLRPWQHLAQTQSEMFRDLLPAFGQEFSEVVVGSIYESTRLNRLFTEEYLLQFQTHGLQVQKLIPWVTGPEVDRGLLEEARRRHPAFREFEWEGFNCLLKREA